MPPADLGEPGRTLWSRIVADLGDGWELDARELHWLEQAARCADQIAALEAVVAAEGPTSEGSQGQVVVHPAVQETRHLRIAQLRLLGALQLEDPAVVRGRLSPSSRRAAAAAAARWGRQARIEAQRGA